MQILPRPFLKTKLLPPRLERPLVERPRLIERMTSLLDLPATIVCANAGWGKTTLVADLLRSSDHPSVWYHVDSSDLDVTVFFGYLIQGFRSLIPDFGNLFEEFVLEGEDLSTRGNQLGDLFVNEISEQVDTKVIVVLDDFHNADASEGIRAAVDRMLQYAPDVLHFIITSRSMPNVSLTRLRSKGLVGVLDRQDLAFTKEETEQFFTSTLGMVLCPELITEFQQRTNGWVTGLQLILQSLTGRTTPTIDFEVNQVLAQSEDQVFDYFAEEVLCHEDTKTQQALFKLSLFDRIDPEIASCAVPEMNAFELLASLQKRNLFISHNEGGGADEYRLHPMFRRFLRHRLTAQRGDEGVRAMRREFADQLVKLGRWETAGLQYAAARDAAAVAGILIERGEAMISAGLSELIKQGYQTIVESEGPVAPEIMRLRGHIARTEGDLDLAEDLYSRAASDARVAEDQACEAAALYGLATVMIKRGDYASGQRFASQALQKGGGADLILQAQCEQAIGDCRFRDALETGEFEGAIENWTRGAELARKAGDHRLSRIIAHSLGRPFLFQGDLARAREYFAPLLDVKTPDRAAFPQQAAAYCHVAQLELAVADFDQCERLLDKAAELCRLFDLRNERAVAHEIACALNRERGRLKQARGHYYEAERLQRENQIEMDLSDLGEEQARLLLAEGDLSQAETVAQELLRKRTVSGMFVSAARARMLVGEVLVIRGSDDEARGMFEMALPVFLRAHCTGLVVRCCLGLARALDRIGRNGEALDRLRDALALARRHNYGLLVLNLKLDWPAGFDVALENNVETAYLEAIGARSSEIEDPRRKAASVLEPSTEYDLMVKMLGPIEIFREHERRLAPDAWTLVRALRVLCFLLLRQKRRATKDAIVETFWGDLPSPEIDKNFWPTISYARRALNSNQEVKKNFIRYREGAYFLNPDFAYLIDTEEFERLTSLARKLEEEGRLDAFAQTAGDAIALYRGDLLEEFTDRWVEDARSYYRGLFVSTVKRLSLHSHSAGRYEEEVNYCKIILRRDYYQEDVHRQLMEAYHHLGDRLALREQFDRLKEMLREELGVDPLPETLATYQRLTGRE